MKLTILLAALILSSSCSELKNNISKNKEITNTNVKIKKNITKKVAGPVQESTNHEITGTLKNGVEYEAGLIPEGYTVSLDPYIAKNDLVFSEVAIQIIAKIYGDQVNDESHISIESNIDYTIFKGVKSRYRLVPTIESNDEISAFTISSIL